MNIFERCGKPGSIGRRLGTIGLALGLVVSAGLRAETIAGIDFDDDAFVDTVISSSGSFGPSVWFPASVGAGDASAIIGANVDTFAHSLAAGSYIEVGFKDNAIVNGPGPDVGIFELGNIMEPQFFTLSVADMVSSTNIVQVNTGFTGFTNSRGTNINYGTLDLSDLGVAPNAKVKSLVFTSVCDAATDTLTSGACITGNRALAAPAVIGALNSVFSGLDPLTGYDDFNSKKYNGCKYCIDSDNWSGRERGDHNAEISRQVRQKKLHMTLRSWGNSDSDSGTEDGRNRVQFRNSLDMSGACFVPRVRKYKLKNCAANSDDGRVRIRYLGNFYDTDNADSGEEDGLVYAGIRMQRYGDSGDKSGLFEVSAWAQECEGADCDTDAWSTYDGIDDPDLDFGTVNAGKNKKAMCIGYDRDNHELVFAFGKITRVVNLADHGLPAFGDNVELEESWHVIELRNDTENCTAGVQHGYIDADVDNVGIREFQ